MFRSHSGSNLAGCGGFKPEPLRLRSQTSRSATAENAIVRAAASAALANRMAQSHQRSTLTLIDAPIRLYIDSSQIREDDYELLGAREQRANHGEGSRGVCPLRCRPVSRTRNDLRRSANSSKWYRRPLEAAAGRAGDLLLNLSRGIF